MFGGEFLGVAVVDGVDPADFAVAVVGVNPGAFLASFFTQGTLVDLFGGEIKCILFGALVAAMAITLTGSISLSRVRSTSR